MFSSRVDGLAKREFTPSEMVEHFKDRSDFLYYRQVTYDKQTRKTEQEKPRDILRVVERFHPNPATSPNRDVAERTFLVSENKIEVVYQFEEGRITASTREFVTPPINPDQAVILTFDPALISMYQVI